MMPELISKLEALLFIYGEPLEVKKLAKMLGAKQEEVENGLTLLEEELKRSERGLMLVQDKGRIQLVTKPEFSKLVEDITKEEFTEDLTPATLETLSIIAYAGPINRADLEYIRGVNSSFILRNLLMRGLVEREPDPKRMNAFVYTTSFELLKKLGLAKNNQLPEYQKYNDLVKTLYAETKVQEEVKQEGIISAEGVLPASGQKSASDGENEEPQNNETPSI